MRKLSIIAVVLVLVAAAAVAVWASVVEAPWEQAASHPSPSPTVQRLDDEMVEVARQLLSAWKTADHDAMKALMDEDGAVVGRGRPIPFSQWADVPSEKLCEQSVVRNIVFPICTAYQIANVTVGNRACQPPTPAEAANGYGKTCTYWLAYAFRRPTDAAYRDRDFCVEVRVKNSVPRVTYAKDGSRCD